MKNKIKNLMLAAASVLLFAACKKEQVQVEKIDKSILTNAVTVENGYLKFRDQKAFDSLQNVIINYSAQELGAWEKSLTGFSSYRSTYLTAQNEYVNVNSSEAYNAFKKKYSDLILIRPDSSLTYRFGTPFSAIITNNSGEVKIGDQFRKYTGENSLILYTGSHKNFTELKNSSELTILPVKKLTMLINNKQSLMPSTGQRYFNEGMLSQQLFYSGDNRRRVYIELWYGSSGNIYFSVLQELKKTFGGWRTNETDYYSNGVNLRFEYGAPGQYSNFTSTFNPQENASGPIIYNMGSVPGPLTAVTGSARFTTGGVPDAPTIYY